MIKPVSSFLRAAALAGGFAAIAGAQDLPAQGGVAASLPADSTSWPWIAFCAIVLTLGAIAWSSRRRNPFGNVG